MKSTERFSDRVENYIKYRPGYPPQILQYLKEEINLTPNNIIADIGSGTGISTEVFLKNGNKVYAVEPNKEMREAAERLLKDYTEFISINGTAEETNLKQNSIDIITVGQAFHWFNVNKCKSEFNRILYDNGFVILMWNIRTMNMTGIADDYEKLLLKFGTDYENVKNTNNVTNDILKNFYTNGYKVKEFDNFQTFDFEGLKGRLLSSSYVPNENDSVTKEMLSELGNIFNKHKSNGVIKFEYKASVYFGKLN
ncbi:MAG: class I SAM-dependent methyltransferase [Saprospiraceae bacterium]